MASGLANEMMLTVAGFNVPKAHMGMSRPKNVLQNVMPSTKTQVTGVCGNSGAPVQKLNIVKTTVQMAN